MKSFLLSLKEDAEAEAGKLKADFEKAADAAKEAVDSLNNVQNAEINHWHDIYAWADGKVKSYPFDDPDASHKDQAMKTLAVMTMKSNELVAPCDGVVGPVMEDENAIAFIIDPSLIVVLRVCKKCADFEKDADILVKQGQVVKKGQPLVSFGKHIEAKTKMLLLSPDSIEEVQNLGLKPVQKAGKVDLNQPIMAKAEK